MGEILSYPEERAVQVIQKLTDEQLLYKNNEFSLDYQYEFVDFMLVSEDRIAFLVPKDYFISAVLEELGFRDLL